VILQELIELEFVMILCDPVGSLYNVQYLEGFF